MIFSIVIPVFDRPLEIKELLQSLVSQSLKNFEVIVVEDGSYVTCKQIVVGYKSLLDIQYYFMDNVGQGFARNFGMEKAKGDYFILFDSDCIIPPDYVELLAKAISKRKLDAHGGPDAARGDFSAFQKAMNYSMTSFLTTAGIRGKMKNSQAFQARGFNMGLSKQAFKATGGFVDPNRGEDIELSIRLKKLGFKLELVEEAFVYHKRKNTLKSFCLQSYSFGKNRINVSRFHPKAIKFVHVLPLFFLLSWIAMLVFFLVMPALAKIGAIILGIWCIAIWIDAIARTRSIFVGLLSIFTSFGQLSFYGAGLMVEWLNKKMN